MGERARSAAVMKKEIISVLKIAGYFAGKVRKAGAEV
jgi:hypothetical protein